MAVTRQFLSGGTANGRPINVTQTATAGNLLHTSGGNDELWLFASNVSGSDVVLTIELGGVSSPGDLLKITVPANDTIPVLPGAMLANGLIARAWAATTAVINVFGYANRIT